MRPGIRKLTLTAHVTSSVGWLGAVVAYLAIAVAGLTSRDAELVRAAYLVTALIGWLVIVPLSFAALLTGLVQSLGTEWGLFRYYWVGAKFVLSIYKPWGRTAYGRRGQMERTAAVVPDRSNAGRYVILALAVLLALFILLHLAGGGFRGH